MYRAYGTSTIVMDPTYPLVPIANFLACFLVLLPLTTSIRRSWNIGVIAYASWVAIEAFYTAINCIVWKDNSRIVVPVWCDISKFKPDILLKA